MAFQSGLAIQAESSSGANFTKVYVRLLSTRLHCMLRMRAPGVRTPHSAPILAFQTCLQSHFTLAQTLSRNCRGLLHRRVLHPWFLG